MDETTIFDVIRLLYGVREKKIKIKAFQGSFLIF